MSKTNRFGFFGLLKENSGSNYRAVLFYALVAGISNTALLTVINNSAQETTHGEINAIYLAEFVVLICLFYLSKRFILIRTIYLVENIIANIRKRIINSVRESDLYFLDRLGTSTIYARVTQDTATISEAGPILINAFQSGVMIVFILVYLAMISISAFIAVVATLSLAVVLFITYTKAVRSEMVRATKLEARFFSLLESMLMGMKELKLNRKKNQEVVDHLSSNISESQTVKIDNSSRFAVSSMFSETSFYVVMGIIVFLLPVFDQGHAEDITKIITAVFFIVSPLNRLVGSLPVFARSSVAIKNIADLEESLKNVTPPAASTNYEKFADFKTIELQDVYFEHLDPAGDITFQSGPHNFCLNRGDKIFITGGNGSGKSTFLKLLTSLYTPNRGTILVDGIPVRGNDFFPFRELFFAIFTDFHLFERLYGVDADPDKVNEILLSLGITPDKVVFEENKFTNLNLSTGQRKRLALVTCLMEDKPIFIMDEVAADQDPEFKKLFYTILLPKWNKEDGKTIILATHDDAYFTYGRRMIMENGKIVFDAEK